MFLHSIVNRIEKINDSFFYFPSLSLSHSFIRSQSLCVSSHLAMSMQQGFDVTKSPHIELLHARMEYQTLQPVFKQQEVALKDLREASRFSHFYTLP